MPRYACACAAVLGFFLCGRGLSEEEKVDYPPQTKLLGQAPAAKAPDGATTESALYAFDTERSYGALRFTVAPADSTKGCAFLAYCMAQRKLVTEIEDLNALCGQETRAGVLGQRVACVGPDGLWGTRAAPGEGTFPGGHVIRAGKDLGVVEPGCSVAAFDQQWAGALWMSDSKTEKCRIALIQSADGKKFRLYGVLSQKLAYLGVEGGPELKGFYAEGDFLYFRSPDGAAVRKSLKADAPPEPVKEDKDGAILRRTDPNTRNEKLKAVCEGVAPNCVFSVGPMSKPPEYADIVVQGHMQEGYVCFARDGGREGEAAHLFCWRPSAGAPVDLGPLASCEGQTLSRVYALRNALLGRIAVLAGNGSVTVLQVYEPPLIETVTAIERAVAARAHGSDPTAKIRTVDSLYKFGEQPDRGFDPMLAASDGKIYFGAMPHHPTKGSPIFRYDPAADKLEALGEIDELAGTKGPGLVPDMIHAAPFEMNGRIYFTGQDPFYGNRGFPGMTKENTKYAGSPLVACEIKSGAFSSLGIPFQNIPAPGEGKVLGAESLFYITGDPKKNVLYLRRTYEEGYWYSLKIGADGKPAGPPTPLALPVHATSVHVTPDGAMYYPTVKDTPKDGGAARDAKAPGVRSPGEIHRFDPGTGKDEVVVTFDAETLNGAAFPSDPKAPLQVNNKCQWIRGQDGQAEIIGRIPAVHMLVRFNTKTGELRKAFVFFPDNPAVFPAKLGQLIWTGPCYRHGEKVYWLPRVGVKNVRMVRLLAADLAAGSLTDCGILVDQNGRHVVECDTGTFGPDGKFYLGGMIQGRPSDPYTIGRAAFGPGKTDSGFFVIERLP
ncbi:MAG: hypothetical protein NTW87_17635 [Planctomycetota bacterium]|nr:hypothetical protein [Planctomycetota bacterium]